MSPIAVPASLFDFFHDKVEDARAVRRAELSDASVLYLAHLLAERARSDHPHPEADTLAALHATAATQPRPADQARAWRELGDRTLHALGAFRAHVDAHRAVSADYYASMGRQGYERADRVLKRFFADCFGPLFAELAHRFDAAVEVVAEVHAVTDDPIDALYRTWLETGSEEAADRLRARGLVLPRRGGEA